MTAPQQNDLLESKTGKTGAAALGLGLAAYLASKEVSTRRLRQAVEAPIPTWANNRVAFELTVCRLQILILHNESVVVASIAAVTYGLMKYAGPDIAATLDERAQGIHTSLEQGRKARIAAIEAEIEAQVSATSVWQPGV